ncbi:hypothetical protein EV130_11261 [Rhizobium azibense]|uniref:Uncharacterized protein n=1 Tax=Rhizobium azibense TaxID=1136135 RepID=A0A4R3QG36_9HYPH|nr:MULTISPECIES: hypothetical protein [Rhizobium]TCU20688.1 hypothetical protein EV130_11261 [Rhizobium azibense]TCU35065.1 hypothetical protein EV129_11060 [Rhizobium azibense]
MSLFELVSFTEDEIELVTSVVGRWSERNHVDVKSEHGQAALTQAIALVSSGMRSPGAIVGRLDEVCAPPAPEYPKSLVDE